jgi:hypothetical protein
MPAILKDGRFWTGFLLGYLIVVFLPSLSFKRLTSKASGGGS